MAVNRVFLIVLDSFGIGHGPDAWRFQDEGSNTFASVRRYREVSLPNLAGLGLYAIEGVEPLPVPCKIHGSYGRLTEASMGKDTTVGHWEIAGILSEKALPVYPGGFPEELISQFERLTGKKVLCNRPYSGTEVIRDYGEEQVKSRGLIVYTSADSVFQVAAHEEAVPLEELYRDCRIARELLKGKHGVGRVIARPFTGEKGSYQRTSGRHDFSLTPPAPTMMDYLKAKGFETWGIGKINDIFAGKGITRTVSTKGNRDGMEKTLLRQKEAFRGLCFVNLVDYDMLYGHRNDCEGYGKALEEFDMWLPSFMENMEEGDVLMITADHGCDPGYPGTDHTRERVPLLIYGPEIRTGVDLKTRDSYGDVAATILDMFQVQGKLYGKSFWEDLRKK